MTIDRATAIALSSLLAGLLVTVWLSFGMGTGAINDYERFVRYTARLAFFLFLPVFVLGGLFALAASAWLLRIAAFVQKTRGRVPAAT